MRLGLRLGAVVGSLAAASVVRGAARPLDSPSIAVSSLSSSPALEAPLTSSSVPLSNVSTSEGRRSSGCFPALSFKTPKGYLPESIDDWWCDQDNEYGFMGFSYEVTACQSQQQLRSDFENIRNRFHGRYVRLYGVCNQGGFYNDVIEAAWDAGIGIHALIWFGFDGGDEWKWRRDELFGILHSNPKAKFVTRAVQFGSEPLFDQAIDPYELATQVNDAKANLASLGIPVTVSDFAYSYQRAWDRGARQVLENVDIVDVHMLPFFSAQASLARYSWPLVMNDLDWFVKNANGKKMYLSENGWPSATSPGVQPNSREAVANVENEHDYFTLLDHHCPDFKSMTAGGVGWFAHIYSDSQEPGYGIYNQDGELKFPFQPRTSC